MTRPPALLLTLAFALVLVACGTTASSKRDLEVEGTLPRAIGLGAFASSCLFLCYVRAQTTQGDVVREDAGADSITVHREATEDIHGNAGKPNKPRLAVKPAAKKE